jgi:hypothetical protein
MKSSLEEVYEVRLRLQEKLSKMTEEEAERYIYEKSEKVIREIEALRQEREKKKELEHSFS